MAGQIADGPGTPPDILGPTLARTEELLGVGRGAVDQRQGVRPEIEHGHAVAMQVGDEALLLVVRARGGQIGGHGLALDPRNLRQIDGTLGDARWTVIVKLTAER